MLPALMATPKETTNPPIKPNQPTASLINICRKKLIVNQKATPEKVSAFLLKELWKTNRRTSITIWKTPKARQNCMAVV